MRAIAPFVLQGIFLIIDECVCHRRRGLGRWERLGHPVDTLAFVAALAVPLACAPSPSALALFAGASVVSCAVITKDEWEHGRRCGGFENWLHAWLFMLHPTTLIWAGHLWWTGHADFARAVGGAAAAALTFAIYQIGYWTWWGRRT